MYVPARLVRAESPDKVYVVPLAETVVVDEFSKTPSRRSANCAGFVPLTGSLNTNAAELIDEDTGLGSFLNTAVGDCISVAGKPTRAFRSVMMAFCPPPDANVQSNDEFQFVATTEACFD